ncbi:MAG TPA: PadR family transcriptional regulator [Kofleriaceae bacterium]
MTEYVMPLRISRGEFRELMHRCARQGRRHAREHGWGRGDTPFLARGRAGRGDIRAAILALLAEQPMHGYQIMRELSERSGGAWRISPGSVYPTLSQLEDEELVQAEQQGSKRVFSLTEAGQAEAAGGATAPWQDVGSDVPEPVLELRDLMFQVRTAARQVVHAGSEKQIAEAATLLRETRRRLYQLLAEDDEPSAHDA